VEVPWSLDDLPDDWRRGYSSGLWPRRAPTFLSVCVQSSSTLLGKSTDCSARRLSAPASARHRHFGQYDCTPDSQSGANHVFAGPLQKEPRETSLSCVKCMKCCSPTDQLLLHRSAVFVSPSHDVIWWVHVVLEEFRQSTDGIPSRPFGYEYLLGLLAMIKCSICSYQCDNWYVSNRKLACHINFSWGCWFVSLLASTSRVALAWHFAKRGAPLSCSCRFQ